MISRRDPSFAQSRRKIQKRIGFFGSRGGRGGGERRPPPRIISVQTRRNRSSDRFNLPDSAPRSQQRRRNLGDRVSKKRGRLAKAARPGFSNCRSRSFLSRNNGTDAPTLSTGGEPRGISREGGPPCLLGLFSVDYPAERGVNTTVIVCPDKEKSAPRRIY